MKKIIIMAGGTCGHIFPGLEIAKSLINKGWKVFWLGTSKNIESKIVPKYGITIKYINISGVRGKNLFELMAIPFKLIIACYQAKKIIENINPDIILGMGGYVSVPGGIISYLYKKPLIIHEQNKIAGLANKLLSKFTTINMQAFANTILTSKSITVGNPLRTSITNLKKSWDRFENRSGPLRILVVGGSQGTQIFNFCFPKVALVLKNKIKLWHQIGKKNINIIHKLYDIHNNLAIYKITPFIKNISKAYFWADLIICRAGALTVSEIQYIGLPAIFVPFPHKDQHQYWNAYPLKMIGGAKIIMQERFNVNVIITLLKNLNRQKLIVMAKKLRSSYKLNSIKTITKIIENITH
ncbi:UDP-N-acetylglucosamine-N-acetylmuramyl-pentapeptide pyrophosphoryl-undecaprenol N-acetylglucosamine transferase [Buchnera aphidicola str. Bp (Baizongia pistaciae)]|uniref:UDP-N-acetylglucosamine--N-acetylmuramyl-(pentapeptide) pyrophosphoryl-undecaprenol N-acetylglucosamine transferase n=1 Tax=Buchnera aphidicola subsp. Baizongia pistaciae (strain Bp) TaxID=224915 RepID=MURG_BUCBP|nr:undecaprenyldiphospho-muramoylpentapeptide beta-N-acetylglucosaminyltransferase [Buchnera aphidicola]P59424.1 RecName: Full=UDP-N-acetylglucosamine--N-acetylmuramyl-(pentapeptide) pyrophosphoryl-undecaprenol N-acetylglucosamine transferase; AltName: Full=Undecaprenyl-PP-MurNAc-pentapeptide-UDPGlcNAc GlcNAc transferase [Buchnera aphidicola str. Bp (Baizongia pistaciae)]AAO26930.1 UDP-N-acetylglucosamine-N-acetylmuramyl-pentapeptide pyrophosphoryl-undecaprenol N-acetylglucosamine transferase [Bu